MEEMNKNETEPALTNAERIKDAAMRLFSRYGYGTTTVRMIAKEAGLSQGQITVHFGSKEGLYESIVNDVMSITASYTEPLQQEMEELLDQNELTKEKAWELIGRHIDNLIDFCFVPQNRGKLMMLNVIVPDSVIVKKANATFQNTVLRKDELLLTQLIQCYSKKKGYLRARVVSRAVNGAIVSFSEHKDFLMTEVYSNSNPEQAAARTKNHLKNYVMNSIRTIDEMDEVSEIV